MGRLLDQPTDHTSQRVWVALGGDAGKASSAVHGAPDKEGMMFKKVSLDEGSADGSKASRPCV